MVRAESGLSSTMLSAASRLACQCLWLLQEDIIKVHANNDRNKTTFFMVFIITSMSKGMSKYAIIKEKHKNSDDGGEKEKDAN